MVQILNNQELHLKCEDLALRLTPKGANLTVFAESAESADNVLWSVDLVDEDHRIAVVEMISSGIELRQSLRYGAIFFDGIGSVTITAASREEMPVTKFYEIHEQMGNKVLVAYSNTGVNRIYESLFEISSRNDPDYMELAESGLAPAIVYGRPKIQNDNYAEQRPARRSMVH
jgi:hypothetical protein